MGFSTDPKEQIGLLERYENPLSWNHQPINSDALEGAVRNPMQLEEVVERTLHGSVCSLASDKTHCKAFDLQIPEQWVFGYTL
jgi:hypothetical protein